MWELRRGGVASEPIAENELEAMFAAGTLETTVAARPVGKDAWKPAVRYAPFAAAGMRAPRAEGSSLTDTARSRVSAPLPSKDPARWDQQTQLNMPVPFVTAALPAPPPMPTSSPPAALPSAPPPLPLPPPPLSPLSPLGSEPPAASLSDAPPGLTPLPSAERPPAAAAPRPTPGFVQAIFDTSFTTFVTTRVVRVLYTLFLVFVVVAALASLVVGMITLASHGPARSDAAASIAIAQLVATPLVALLVITLGRVAAESIVVFFGLAEHLDEIRRKTE